MIQSCRSAVNSSLVIAPDSSVSASMKMSSMTCRMAMCDLCSSSDNAEAVMVIIKMGSGANHAKQANHDTEPPTDRNFLSSPQCWALTPGSSSALWVGVELRGSSDPWVLYGNLPIRIRGSEGLLDESAREDVHDPDDHASHVERPYDAVVPPDGTQG